MLIESATDTLNVTLAFPDMWRAEVLQLLAEANLLHSLALAPDHTLEIWQLLERLDKSVDDDGKAQLQVLVSRLRSKLAEHGAPAQVLRAERGKGYWLGLSLQLV